MYLLNKRGLSEVLHKVLIIFIALVAVLILSSYFYVFLHQGGQETISTVECSQVHIEPVTCMYINNTGSDNIIYPFNFSVRASARYPEETSFKELNVLFGETSTNNVIRERTLVNIKSFEIKKIYERVLTAKNYSSVKFTPTLILKDGTTFTCPFSSEISCLEHIPSVSDGGVFNSSNSSSGGTAGNTSENTNGGGGTGGGSSSNGSTPTPPAQDFFDFSGGIPTSYAPYSSSLVQLQTLTLVPYICYDSLNTVSYPVSLFVNGCPPGASCSSGAQSSATTGCINYTLTIRPVMRTPEGNYTLAVSGQGGNQVHYLFSYNVEVIESSG